MTTMTSETIINPADWRVRGSLRHGGLTYGVGEAVPALTLAQAEHYQAIGQLVRLNPDGSTVEPKPTNRQEPKTAEQFLRGTDTIVLRQIIDFRPGKTVLRQMLVLSKETGRTHALRMTLEAICLYAGVKVPPR
jgi:hypothetical protein